MRVLFLTHRLPYAPNRGDRIRAYHVIRTLAPYTRIDVVSLTHSAEEESHAQSMTMAGVRVWTVPVTPLRNVLHAPMALATGRPMTHVLLDSSRMKDTLQRVVSAAAPDVVLAYCSGMAQFAFEPPLARYPLVLDMVDVDSEKWAELAMSGSRALRGIYAREARCLRQFERRAANKALATTVVNTREREVMERISPAAKIVAVPNGIDLETFRPSVAPSAGAQVVFCGVFSYEPNEAAALWLAHEVWPHVRAARPDATLALVGMAPGRRVRALAGNPSIIVTGAVEDTRPYLWGSAVAVAPLHIARGIQNKVLEAVAAGLPCVITPAVRDGLPADIQTACTTAADAEQFAASILGLLALTPSERRRLTESARLGALGWDRQLFPMRELLESAARSGPSIRHTPQPTEGAANRPG